VRGLVTPQAIASDAAGNVYVADFVANTISKVTPEGQSITLAGSAGIRQSLDGRGLGALPGQTIACFDQPGSVALYGGRSTSGMSNVIRKVDLADNVVTTFVGSTGVVGTTDGVGSAARFTDVNALAVDADGNLYVADRHQIRKVTPAGVVTSIAGISDLPGSADGGATTARFSFPRGLTVDEIGTIYVADSGNNSIRKITSSEDIPGATSATYVLSAGTLLAGGTYECVVGDGAGRVVSGGTVVTVAAPPTITTDPQSQTVVAGGTVSFTVGATGAGTLTYQWRKDAEVVSGETQATYTFIPTSAVDGGSFSCVVTDPLGGLVSRVQLRGW